MNDYGLLQMRGKTGDEEEEDGMIVVTREMLEKVAQERGVIRMCMDLQHVLLWKQVDLELIRTQHPCASSFRDLPAHWQMKSIVLYVPSSLL